MSDGEPRPVLASSALRILVSADPWRLVVLDNSGRPLLEEAPALPDGHAGGPLGFQAGAAAPRRRWRGGAVREPPGPDNENPPGTRGWWNATRILCVHSATSDSYEAELETDDPAGRRLSLSIELRDHATVSIGAYVIGETDGVEAVGQGFMARDRERFLGFGERSDSVSIDQGVIENYVGEGPYQAHEYPFLEHTVPPWAIRQRRDASYFPVPWILSTLGYGISVENDEISHVRVRTPWDDRWNVEVESSRLDYCLYWGPTPLGALERFTKATGRQPEPQRWFFGPWYQTGHANHIPIEDERRQLSILRAARAPVSAAETHCRYLPLGEDRGHEADEAARTAFFHSEGLATVSYLNPLVGEEYDEAWRSAADAGALQRDTNGDPYSFEAYVGGRVPPHTQEGQFDFTTKAAAICFEAIAERIVAAGHDGWMEDFGEYTPLDVVQADGSTGTQAHNRYPTDYHAAAASATAALEARHGRRLARFVRSGWRGTAACAPILWGGDPTTSWGFDGLASAIVEGLSAGASGVAMWGSDTGGFFSTEDRLTPELLRRWIQFSALTPVMRTKSSGIEIPPYERPQIWDPDILPTWRRWASLHTQLNDYLMAAHATYRETGRPIMTALELVYPDEPVVAGTDDEYLLGDNLLVAPVIEPACTHRSVVIPEGTWVDFWGAVSFDDKARGLVMRGGTEVIRLTGPQRIEVDVSAQEIPLFVREGAVLGLLSADVDTLSPYGEGSAVVGATERDDRRQLLAFPGGAWAGSTGPGQHVRSELRSDVWVLTIVSDQERMWELSAWLGWVGSPIGVTVGEEPIAATEWSYDAAFGVFRCAMSGAAVRLRVQLEDVTAG